MSRDLRQRFGQVAVLLGGTSAERDISLMSGRAVLDALHRQDIDAFPADPAAPGFLEQVRGADRAFVMLHGRGGEDGVVQGALELLDLPYTGSGVLGSALAMDKVRSKRLWQATGIATPAFEVVREAADLERVTGHLGFPVMVKPAREGSSIGMARADDTAALAQAWREAARYDPEVLVEQWIEGTEYTVALLGTAALPVIRLVTPRAFYDYAAKYEADSTEYHCPSGLAPAEEARLQALALAAFGVLGASGWGRVDILTDATGTAFVIEANTVPGMTDHSLVPMAARAGGMAFDELVVRILETSLDGSGGSGHG